MKRENEIRKFNNNARLCFKRAQALNSVGLEDFSTSSAKFLTDAMFHKLNVLSLRQYNCTLQESRHALQDVLKDSYVCSLTQKIKGDLDMKAMQELLNL